MRLGQVQSVVGWRSVSKTVSETVSHWEVTATLVYRVLVQGHLTYCGESVCDNPQCYACSRP